MDAAQARVRRAHAAIQQIHQERAAWLAQFAELDRRDAVSGREWYSAYIKARPPPAAGPSSAPHPPPAASVPRQQQPFHCPRCDKVRSNGVFRRYGPGGPKVCHTCYTQIWRRRKKEEEEAKELKRQQGLRSRQKK
ncbi:unnamed protein product [Tilletia controversa]|nr:unnamed protein product [Tilletia controversa]